MTTSKRFSEKHGTVERRVSTKQGKKFAGFAKLITGNDKKLAWTAGTSIQIMKLCCSSLLMLWRREKKS